ncbi:uncharacterized protein LOC128668390 [Microplitis demolitor]|uniref:uncharacterized protein LOC128668390 n=1 Tax=Microplitis demolitor TaxID=69319 RepID=UPI00235B5B79|nr:uncharacterized protein LOC128668390 [Microplitis demolitor]
MSFSQLPNEIKRKIFSNLERKERQALRHVDSNWKAIIDDMTKWKDKCSMNEIKPWKNQLIKLQYPSLKSANYKHLKEKELKKIFLLYRKWRKTIDAGRIYLNDFENFPAEFPRSLNFEDIRCSFDLLAGYIAVGITRIGLNWLYKIDEGIHLSHAFYFDDHVDRNVGLDRGIENPISLNFIEVKLWITGTGKLIYVVCFRDQLLFWDVEKKTKIPTPSSIFLQDSMNLINFRRGTDEYFYIINNSTKTMHIIRLDYVGNEITTKKLLIIRYNSSEFLKFIDFHAEERKIMVVYKLSGIKSNTLLTTIVKIPRSQVLPVKISAYDRTHTASFSYMRNANQEYDFTVPCINVVIAVNKFPFFRARTFIVQISRFDERNRHLTTLKRYEIPESIIPNDYGIQFMTIYFNYLFLGTTKAELTIFKLKNLQHLKYLNFDNLEKKVVRTEIFTKLLKITKYNNQIIMLLADWKEVKLLTCNLNF